MNPHGKTSAKTTAFPSIDTELATAKKRIANLEAQLAQLEKTRDEQVTDLLYTQGRLMGDVAELLTRCIRDVD